MRVLVFLLVISLRITAQISDSLLPSILAVTNDTERVNLLYKRGFALRHRNPQTAYNYARLCNEYAEKSHSKKHIARSYNLLGVLFYKKGDYKTALSYHFKALNLRIECNDELGIAFSQTNIGNVYSDLKQYDKAEDAYLKALAVYKKTGNTSKLVDCLVNIGTLKHQTKLYDAAAENYLMALKLTEVSDYDTRAMCLTNLGEAVLAKNKIEMALAYNEDALKLRLLSDNKVETADNYLNIGAIYVLKKEFDKALHYIDTAYVIAKANDYFELTFEAQKIYSLYYSEIKNYEKAFFWLSRYNTMSDSLLLVETEERVNQNFNEEVQKNTKPLNAEGFSNYWQLILFAAMVILIPFYLIRFKR